MDVEEVVMRILFTTTCCPAPFDNEILSAEMVRSINMLLIRRKVNNFSGFPEEKVAENCVDTAHLNLC